MVITKTPMPMTTDPREPAHGNHGRGHDGREQGVPTQDLVLGFQAPDSSSVGMMMVKSVKPLMYENVEATRARPVAPTVPRCTAWNYLRPRPSTYSA